MVVVVCWELDKLGRVSSPLSIVPPAIPLWNRSSEPGLTCAENDINAKGNYTRFGNGLNESAMAYNERCSVDL
jgi:hypothetical protein